MDNCKKCLAVKNEWFSSIVKDIDPIRKELKIKFDFVFGKGEFDKAYIKGEVNSNWEGICNFCKTKYHISMGI